MKVAIGCPQTFVVAALTLPLLSTLFMANNDPAPKFARFERVVVNGESIACDGFCGEHGTILWRDSCSLEKRQHQSDSWMYVVSIAARECCRTFWESDLHSEGIFENETVHIGKRAEISFDVVMEPDMDVIEGSYRRPGRFWQVSIFTKDDVPSLRYRPSSWPSGMTGIVFRVPRKVELNREYAVWAMSRAFGHPDWVEVKGPDSIALR
jgi:hypothetical protein